VSQRHQVYTNDCHNAVNSTWHSVVDTDTWWTPDDQLHW